MSETLTETPERAAQTVIPWLCLVLDYDDLLIAPELTIRLDRARLPLAIGRAAEGAPGIALGAGGLAIADRFLSSKQARIERRAGETWLVDEKSRNGSFVNGERITERCLADRDLVELGHKLFCFRLLDEAAVRALSAPDEAREVGRIATRNAEMAILLGDVARIAASRESVLVLAETGAGKESLAATIHRRSGRAGAYVTIDAGAVPESLFESTFFGHRRGAFTGAIEARAGEIVRADEGTLFLDELGNLAPASQAKLLRVIEEGTVTPVGASSSQTVDVRWIGATNRELFADGETFRQDLLRRFAGFVARIPPLRRRREDLGVLAAAALGEAGFPRVSITVDAARALFLGPLPGNVRQLGAALRSAALLARDERIAPSHLPSYDDARAPREEPPAPPLAKGTPDRDALAAALSATKGNVVRAAKLLSTHPRQVYRWIEKHGLSIDDYRS